MSTRKCIIQKGAVVVMVVRDDAQWILFKEDEDYERKMAGTIPMDNTVGHYEKLLTGEVTFDESDRVPSESGTFSKAFRCGDRWGNKWLKMLVKTSDCLFTQRI